MRPPLAEQLIAHAARTDFTRSALVIWQILLKIFAVPAESYQVVPAVLTHFVNAIGISVMPDTVCPFFGRSEGR